MRHPFRGMLIPLFSLAVFASACQSSQTGREPALNQATTLNALEEVAQSQQSLHSLLDTGQAHWAYFVDTAVARNVQIMAYDSSFQKRYQKASNSWKTQAGVSQQAVLKWYLLVQDQALLLRRAEWVFPDKDRLLHEKHAGHLKATAKEELTTLSNANADILSLKAHLDTLPVPPKPVLPTPLPPVPNPVLSPSSPSLPL